MKNTHTYNSGFTLIELLVSVTIFTIVMVMALGALLALSSADRRAETLKSGIDNLTFALDSMSRAIRTGSVYHCMSSGTITSAQDCPSGDNFISFLSATGVQTYYQLDTAQDGSSLCGQTQLPYGCIERKLTSGGTWIPITSPDIVVQNSGFLFHVVGALPGTTDSPIRQPKVTITASSTVLISATQRVGVFMQTTATQRIYDQ